MAVGLALGLVAAGGFCVLWPRDLSVHHADIENGGGWSQSLTPSEVRIYGAVTLVLWMSLVIVLIRSRNADTEADVSK